MPSHKVNILLPPLNLSLTRHILTDWSKELTKRPHQSSTSLPPQRKETRKPRRVGQLPFKKSQSLSGLQQRVSALEQSNLILDRRTKQMIKQTDDLKSQFRKLDMKSDQTLAVLQNLTEALALEDRKAPDERRSPSQASPNPTNPELPKPRGRIIRPRGSHTNELHVRCLSLPSSPRRRID